MVRQEDPRWCSRRYTRCRHLAQRPRLHLCPTGSESLRRRPRPASRRGGSTPSVADGHVGARRPEVCCPVLKREGSWPVPHGWTCRCRE